MRNFLYAILIPLAFYCLMVLCGCAAASLPHGPPVHHWFGFQIPDALVPTAETLDWLIPISLVTALIGISLFFTVPEAHRLELTVAGSAGSICIGCILLRVTLWIFPWIAGGIAVLALAFFGWKVYQNWGKIASAKVLPWWSEE